MFILGVEPESVFEVDSSFVPEATILESPFDHANVVTDFTQFLGVALNNPEQLLHPKMLCDLCTKTEDCYYCGQRYHRLGDANTQNPLQGRTGCTNPGVLLVDSLPLATPRDALAAASPGSGAWVLSGPTLHLSFALCRLLPFPPSYGSGS